MNFIGRCSCGVEIRNPSEASIAALVGRISPEVANHLRVNQSARAGAVAGQWAAHVLENSHASPTLTIALETEAAHGN